MRCVDEGQGMAMRRVGWLTADDEGLWGFWERAARMESQLMRSVSGGRVRVVPGMRRVVVTVPTTGGNRKAHFFARRVGEQAESMKAMPRVKRLVFIFSCFVLLRV